MYRTQTCNELTLKQKDKSVEVAGWVHSRRDHGGVIFVDLRDKYGVTQVVFDPSHNKQVHAIAEHLGREFVIHVKGKVRPRPKEMVNPKLNTGQIEVIADRIDVLNKSVTPPFEINDSQEVNEELRLQYRYLDLRSNIMQNRLKLRHAVSFAIRTFLTKQGFTEVETPVLVKSTPEGARDYVVPSRVHPGKFFALPQSPQLYKQILMASGVDKYFQLAKCLRDEDLRADRQPEHTQLDMEMSFVHQDDVLSVVESLYAHIFKETMNVKLKTPFTRLSYDESMQRFGTDKPDLRFGMELIDVTEVAKKADFKVFKDAQQVKCLNPDHDFSRSDVDSLIAWAQENGAKGLAWMRVTKDGLESSIVKFFSDDVQKELLKTTKAKPGSMLFFVADKSAVVAEVLGRLRNHLADKLDMRDPKKFEFCWVLDFPLFEWNADEDRWDAAHHLFSRPKEDHLDFLEKDPGKVKADLYDLVLNGTELGSGSIRINTPELQERVLKVIGMQHEEAQEKFGFLMKAFTYGAPPHGGIGIGFDRTVALMAGLTDIREVIAFPRNKKAENPMDGSPSDVDDKQMKELHIKTSILKKS